MYRPVVFGSVVNAAFLTLNSSGAVAADHDTLETAKKAAQSLLGHASYVTTFKQGYDIFILDIDKGIVASRARVEPSPLTWKDTA